MKTSTRNWLIGSPVLCALIPLVCVPAIEWMGVAPHGGWWILWLTPLFTLPALVAVPVFLAALVGLLFQRVRLFCGILALCSMTYLVALGVSFHLGGHVRMNAFHRLAERSKPLVNAIRAFEQKNGRPPESLEALVPEFIACVPSTGMGAYPDYQYKTPATNYDGNPWVIVVSTPSGGINFDEFLYFPLTNYPSEGYGGLLERIGDWAYVHE